MYAAFSYMYVNFEMKREPLFQNKFFLFKSQNWRQKRIDCDNEQ